MSHLLISRDASVRRRAILFFDENNEDFFCLSKPGFGTDAGKVVCREIDGWIDTDR